ncbi:uncharacterized protein [Antedon mediterranea]|uniref:uncharacterized protein isoform X2 n=1 Tax=Antedon mediterranea TaxID=105859 RepID=UPI003AF8D5C2
MMALHYDHDDKSLDSCLLENTYYFWTQDPLLDQQYHKLKHSGALLIRPNQHEVSGLNYAAPPTDEPKEIKGIPPYWLDELHNKNTECWEKYKQIKNKYFKMRNLLPVFKSEETLQQDKCYHTELDTNIKKIEVSETHKTSTEAIQLFTADEIKSQRPNIESSEKDGTYNTNRLATSNKTRTIVESCKLSPKHIDETYREIRTILNNKDDLTGGVIKDGTYNTNRLATSNKTRTIVESCKLSPTHIDETYREIRTILNNKDDLTGGVIKYKNDKLEKTKVKGTNNKSTGRLSNNKRGKYFDMSLTSLQIKDMLADCKATDCEKDIDEIKVVKTIKKVSKERLIEQQDTTVMKQDSNCTNAVKNYACHFKENDTSSFTDYSIHIVNEGKVDQSIVKEQTSRPTVSNKTLSTKNQISQPSDLENVLRIPDDETKQKQELGYLIGAADTDITLKGHLHDIFKQVMSELIEDVIRLKGQRNNELRLRLNREAEVSWLRDQLQTCRMNNVIRNQHRL